MHTTTMYVCTNYDVKTERSKFKFSIYLASPLYVSMYVARIT